MNEARKKSIDNLVEELHKKYSFDKIDSFKKLAEENGIKVFESSKVIVEFCNREGIYINKYLFSDNKKQTYGHELGHILLGHFKEELSSSQKEREADYFSMRLGYKNNVFLCFLEFSIQVITKPITSVGYAFSVNYRRKYQRKLISTFNKGDKNKS